MQTEFRSRWSLLIAALAILTGCNDSEPQTTPASVPVAVITVAPSPLQLSEDLPGRVAAVRSAEIRPQVSGIVQKRLFEQGSEVRAGQPLFQINAAPFQAEMEMATANLQRAAATLTRAELQARRLEALIDADAISRQSYDDATSQRDQAAAELAQARATLARRQLDVKFATIDAPIAGRIDQALITEGALVGSADANPMARIQQIDQVYVDVRQPSTSLESLRQSLDAQYVGDRVPVAILGSDGQPYDVHAHILFSALTVDAGTGDVLLRVLVDNPKRQLLPGQFVRARVPRANYPEALSVPQQAVVRIAGKPQVWIVDAENKAHLTPVELGELIDRRYRVQAGISVGQKIVVEGMERLTDGAAVAPSDWQVAESTAATAVLNHQLLKITQY